MGKKNSIRIYVDASEWQDMLDAIEGPGAATVEALDATFGALATEVDLRIPVDTGSLRGSGRISTEVTPDSWEGKLEYGGPSTGPKGYVVYARQAIYHAGSFDGLEAYNDDFEDAMRASMNAKDQT